MERLRDRVLKYLKEYKSQKADAYSIKRVGCFGSVARGEEREDSDIDIVVEFNKPDLFNLIAIKQDLKEYFKRDVDVVALWSKMNPKLKRRIEKDAIYV